MIAEALPWIIGAAFVAGLIHGWIRARRRAAERRQAMHRAGERR